MTGAAIGQWECVRVLSETEFFDDLTAIDVPVLVMHGEDDQICPFPTTGARSVKLLKNGTLISYPGLPHGMPTTHADIINKDLLAFIRAERPNDKRSSGAPKSDELDSIAVVQSGLSAPLN